MEMYVEGVSTRKVREITEILCGTSFSKSLVSELAGQLDTELDAWRNRPLTETTYPYLSVDARYEHVRQGGQVVSQGVLIVPVSARTAIGRFLRSRSPTPRAKRRTINCSRISKRAGSAGYGS